MANKKFHTEFFYSGQFLSGRRLPTDWKGTREGWYAKLNTAGEKWAYGETKRAAVLSAYANELEELALRIQLLARDLEELTNI